MGGLLMRIMLVGINHRTAGVELRERLAWRGRQLEEVIEQLRRQYTSCEAVILSTCNRTELYLARPIHDAPSVEQALAFLAETCGVTVDVLRSASIHRENDQAVGHLFRVASGLESMILGEPQILGQVKRAYEVAGRCRTVGPVLHRVFQKAIGVAKQVRTSTGIDAGRVSIGSVAVDFARQIFERFDDKTILGIGAGEMAKITLHHLHRLKPGRLWLVNRSLDKAQALASKLGLAGQAGGARAFDDLDQLLTESDIVVTSAGARKPIVTAARFQPLLRRRRLRPLFMVDIAVPRNIESAVGNLKNVYLYNIDDLQKVVQQTHIARGEHAQGCEAMLFDAVRVCMSEVQNRDIGQLIRALRQRLQELGQLEQARTQRKIASLPSHELAQAMPRILDEHTRRLINKVLHLPLSQLDQRRPDAPLGFYAAALRHLFALEDGQLDASYDQVTGESEVVVPNDLPQQDKLGDLRRGVKTDNAHWQASRVSPPAPSD